MRLRWLKENGKTALQFINSFDCWEDVPTVAMIEPREFLIEPEQFKDEPLRAWEANDGRMIKYTGRNPGRLIKVREVLE